MLVPDAGLLEVLATISGGWEGFGSPETASMERAIIEVTMLVLLCISWA